MSRNEPHATEPSRVDVLDHVRRVQRQPVEERLALLTELLVHVYPTGKSQDS